MSTETANFYNYSLKGLQQRLQGLGKEKFRAQQLFKWVYEQGVTNFDEMTNVSKVFRQELVNLFHFDLPKVVEKLVSRDGTIKLLVDVGDNDTVEAVLIPAEDRLTLCVSSEVGCNLACKFCFTGKRKLKKRLSTAQIIGQFLRAREVLPEGKRITNIVFMGMGEPLDNPAAVFGSIDILKEENGINFSRKKITVSTSGLVPLIPAVAEAGVRLAVSLNGSNDQVRTSVMPINQKYPIEVLLDACMDFHQKTKDDITFEYVLLKGVTDSMSHAKELRRLTKNIPCKINLIPFNEHPGADYSRPAQETVTAFKNELIRLGAHVLVRKTKGRDIYAACGQLTSKFEEKPVVMPQKELSQADYSFA